MNRSKFKKQAASFLFSVTHICQAGNFPLPQEQSFAKRKQHFKRGTKKTNLEPESVHHWLERTRSPKLGA